MNEYVSNKLRWLSFVSTWAVVCMHARTDRWGGGCDLINLIQAKSYRYFLFAVPVFFFISGVLFVSSYAKLTYKTFWLNKLRSLYLPTIVWSFLTIIANLPIRIKTGITPSLVDIIGVPFLTISIPDVGRFWYVRDLLIFFMLAPLIFRICRRILGVALLFLFSVMLSYVFRPWHPGPLSVFFFCCGVYCGHHIDLLQYNILLFSRRKMLFFSVFGGGGNGCVRLV